MIFKPLTSPAAASAPRILACIRPSLFSVLIDYNNNEIEPLTSPVAASAPRILARIRPSLFSVLIDYNNNEI